LLDLPFDPEYGSITSFRNVNGHPTDYMVLVALIYSSALRMEAVCSSETSEDFYPSKRRYIPEDSIIFIPEHSTLEDPFCMFPPGHSIVIPSNLTVVCQAVFRHTSKANLCSARLLKVNQFYVLSILHFS
jgi:hypothetical protein